MTTEVRKSFHAVLIAGGTADARLARAKAILHAHFADDPEAARKLEKDAYFEKDAPSALASGRGTFEDLLYVDPEPGKQEITVKCVERMTAFFAQRPFASTGKAAIIPDAERMNETAQNKLLKLLEEPFAGDVILLLTRTPGGLLPTIQSRCTLTWLGHERSGAGAGAQGEDIRELVRILLFGKAVLPEAFAILEKYEKQDAAALLAALQTFLRDLATGAEDPSLIPADSIASREAAARLNDRQKRLCKTAVRIVEAAERAHAGGLKERTLMRDMALSIKMEAMHA